MIQIDSKKNCSGCTTCASICPKDCIHMVPDEEGYLYPFVDAENCIDYGACERVCSVKNPIKEESHPQKAYLVQHKDVRLDSTSSEAFTAIATVVLEKGGVVFGAAYDELFHVHHTYVETLEDLGQFRNSKYV